LQLDLRMALLGGAIAALVWGAVRLGEVPSLPARNRNLTADQARAVNAGIPFVTTTPQTAKPYRFVGTPAARTQAIQCLATAALYEAGSDERGQKAVIQVVLNRLRLPQYPKTVCGVVYQGSGLTTGCQFSFTCDGSLTRRPEHAGWLAAREAARQALSGSVFAPVGTATHYHADWIVPYWIGTLDKIAMVNTHIFYRPHRSTPIAGVSAR
jgi:spore germination cell wall hydrolase CwlJ-like protein